MNVAIRVSVAYDVLTGFETIYELCDKVVVYEHEADEEVKTTHVHMLLEGYKRKEDTLRNAIKKHYTGPNFALKVKKDDGSPVDDSFITYMSKGTLDPKYNKGYDDGFIATRRGEWVERRVGVRLQSGKLVKDPEEKKVKSKRELLALMTAEIQDGSGTRDILEGIRKVLIRENQVIGQYKMLDYYDSYLMYNQKGKWLDGLVAKINSRIPV